MQETSPELLQWESKGLWTQEGMVLWTAKPLAGRWKDAARREMEGCFSQREGRVHRNLRILVWRRG